MIMVEVLLDTNALLMLFQFKINLERELDRLLGRYEILVPECVLEELKKLSLKSLLARGALRFAERYKKIKAYGKVDLAILELAKKRKRAVITNDRELRMRLRASKLPVIFLRSRTHLEIEGVVG